MMSLSLNDPGNLVHLAVPSPQDEKVLHDEILAMS
jgi:hypothetical protein